MVFALTGYEPTMCPWRGFADDVTREVLDAHAVARTGDGVHLASLAALDPPHHIWEGVQFYARTVARIRDHDLRLAQEEREKKRARR